VLQIDGDHRNLRLVLSIEEFQVEIDNRKSQFILGV